MKYSFFFLLFVSITSFSQNEDGLEIFFNVSESSKNLRVALLEIYPEGPVNYKAIRCEPRNEHFFGFSDTSFVVFVPFGKRYLVQVIDLDLDNFKMADIDASTIVQAVNYPDKFNVLMSKRNGMLFYYYDIEKKAYSYHVDETIDNNKKKDEQ